MYVYAYTHMYAYPYAYVCLCITTWCVRDSQPHTRLCRYQTSVPKHMYIHAHEHGCCVEEGKARAFADKAESCLMNYSIVNTERSHMLQISGLGHAVPGFVEHTLHPASTLQTRGFTCMCMYARQHHTYTHTHACMRT